MSGFDDNPFGDQTIDNPFAVSTEFVALDVSRVTVNI